MKDRIKQLMESQHMNQLLFSQYIGISSASLSSIFNGRTNPSLKTVDAIRKRFPNLNIDWLMFGEGQMFLDGESGEGTPTPPLTTPGEGLVDFSNASDVASPSLFDQPVERGVQNTPKIAPQIVIKEVDKPQRKITEIRIFYNDNTWGTFVPKA